MEPLFSRYVDPRYALQHLLKTAGELTPFECAGIGTATANALEVLRTHAAAVGGAALAARVVGTNAGGVKWASRTGTCTPSDVVQACVVHVRDTGELPTVLQLACLLALDFRAAVRRVYGEVLAGALIIMPAGPGFNAKRHEQHTNYTQLAAFRVVPCITDAAKGIAQGTNLHLRTVTRRVGMFTASLAADEGNTALDLARVRLDASAIFSLARRRKVPVHAGGAVSIAMVNTKGLTSAHKTLRRALKPALVLDINPLTPAGGCVLGFRTGFEEQLEGQGQVHFPVHRVGEDGTVLSASLAGGASDPPYFVAVPVKTTLVAHLRASQAQQRAHPNPHRPDARGVPVSLRTTDGVCGAYDNATAFAERLKAQDIARILAAQKAAGMHLGSGGGAAGVGGEDASALFDAEAQAKEDAEKSKKTYTARLQAAQAATRRANKRNFCALEDSTGSADKEAAGPTKRHEPEPIPKSVPALHTDVLGSLLKTWRRNQKKKSGGARTAAAVDKAHCKATRGYC
jgi:hypothetical protein